MKEIKFIEVKSEIAAGTRGASLGIGAVKVASINNGSSFFKNYKAEEIETVNEVLFTETPTPNAKYIEHVYLIETRVCDSVTNTMNNDQFPFVLAGDH